MPDTPFIALELHDATLWEPSRVLPIIDQMARWGYDALVLHQNDLLDVCTQLGLTANFGVTDLRLKKVRNNAAWLNTLVARLAQFDASLFLEIKEPSFHDSALEFYPGLLDAAGHPDPSSPDWPIFCRRKTEDLIKRVPGLGGLIVNLSSPESRVSLPDHLATHATDMDRAAWFDRMIDAFAAPLATSGKRLYIRDFSYTADMQSDVMAAVHRARDNVFASVKVTAHDYFPRFPENPAMRQAKGNAIVEFEAFGEHMGWGVIPNCRVAEFRDRMMGYRAAGAAGILMRTSWEAITGANALDTLSAVNVYALPRLMDGDQDPTAMVCAWLADVFGLTGAAAEQAADLLMQSWHIPAAAYWTDQVFPRHSCVPSTWQEGWLSMASSGMGRRDRDLGIAPDDPRLTEAARKTLFTEKEEAVALAERLAKEVHALRPTLPTDLADLFGAFEWLPLFARAFELATKATFFAARATADDLAQLPPLKEALAQLATDTARHLDETEGLPHHHHVLFDPEQIRRFAASLPDG